jgi:hypothetical protein
MTSEFDQADLVHQAAERVEEAVAADAETRRLKFDQAIELVTEATPDSDDRGQAALLTASTRLLLAASGPQALGQCKEEEPFANIYVVFDSKGRRLECTHDPPHSSELT